MPGGTWIRLNTKGGDCKTDEGLTIQNTVAKDAWFIVHIHSVTGTLL